MPDRLTWEEKLAALQCLCDCSLRMREPGNWYVSAGYRAICGNGLAHSAYGNGASPQEAVESDFAKMTEVVSPLYIEATKIGKTRRVRWGGFMWVDIPESE